MNIFSRARRVFHLNWLLPILHPQQTLQPLPLGVRMPIRKAEAKFLPPRNISLTPLHSLRVEEGGEESWEENERGKYIRIKITTIPRFT